MNMETLDLHKVYIIGVSGGPDSMALLDVCRRHGVCMVVVHVNYQKRESATRDMQTVQDYCKQYGTVSYTHLFITKMEVIHL